MKKPVFVMVLSLVIIYSFLISWRIPADNDLATRLSRSENFIKWNIAVTAYEKEATILFYRNKGKGDYKRHRQSDLDAIMNNARLSDAAKKDSLAKIGPKTSATWMLISKKAFYSINNLTKSFLNWLASPQNLRKQFS